MNLSSITIAPGSIQGSQVCLVPVQINISDCAENCAALVSNLKKALTRASWMMWSALTPTASPMPMCLQIQGLVDVAKCEFDDKIEFALHQMVPGRAFKPKDRCVGCKCQSRVADKLIKTATLKAAQREAPAASDNSMRAKVCCTPPRLGPPTKKPQSYARALGTVPTINKAPI